MYSVNIMAQLTFCKLQKLVLENMLNTCSHLDSPEHTFVAIYYIFIQNLEEVLLKPKSLQGGSFSSKVKIRGMLFRLSEYILE